MFCPQCGATQSEELKFCKSCGANVQAVCRAVAARSTGEGIDWDKTWVAEMFMSQGERQRRNQELERQSGITVEVKRYQEIKAGVITSCVGLAASIFLYFLMQGIILSGQSTPGDAAILGRVWIAGVVPFLIGVGLMINGTFVSKRLAKAIEKEQLSKPEALKGASGGSGEPPSLGPADTTEFIAPGFGVTEDTTKHLRATTVAARKPTM